MVTLHAVPESSDDFTVMIPIVSHEGRHHNRKHLVGATVDGRILVAEDIEWLFCLVYAAAVLFTGNVANACIRFWYLDAAGWIETPEVLYMYLHWEVREIPGLGAILNDPQLQSMSPIGIELYSHCRGN